MNIEDQIITNIVKAYFYTELTQMTGALIITLHISGHSLLSRKKKCISNTKYLVGAHFEKKKYQ